LDKNKDPLNDTVVDQWKKSSNALLVEIYADHPGQSAGADAKGKEKRLSMLTFLHLYDLYFSVTL